MKRNITLLFSALFILSAFSQKKCFTDEYTALQLKKNPELLAKKEAYLNTLTQKKDVTVLNKIAAPQVVQIPVVFHVIHKTAAQNILDDRLYEQIERLNLDFSGSNPDTANVPDEFKQFIADTKIRFYLATEDPSGNPTTGITRTSSSEYSFSASDDGIKSTVAGGKDSWNTSKYLNIWVGNIDAQILGYALPPFAAGTANDGVVISYKNIGNNNGGQFHLGRTATHEVGHYLGLAHLWGSGAGGCTQDDGIADTPNQAGPHYGNNTHPLSSCGSHDMFMNFMDYGNDDELIMFSKNQETKMETVLAGVRNSLGVVEPLSVNNVTKSNFKLFPNPASSNVILSFDNNVTYGKVSIFDISGREYYSKTIGGSQNLNLDLSNLSNGLYFVSVNDGSTTTQKKMVVRK